MPGSSGCSWSGYESFLRLFPNSGRRLFPSTFPTTDCDGINEVNKVSGHYDFLVIICFSVVQVLICSCSYGALIPRR